MKNLIYTVLFILIFSQVAVADDKKEAEKALKDKLESVIVVLEKKDMDQQVKKKEIVEIVTPIFNFSLMSKLTLGKKHWPSLTKDQQGKFTELFTQRLKDSYLDKMLLYTDEKIEYEAPVQAGKKVQIPTILTSKDNKISMRYKLYKSKQSWKIYDIEIQGVSLISTYRSQFDEILRKKTVDDLLVKLEKPEKK
ncbi:MAG: ABC transporter substrate-binding protein [Thermodesulfobacteriota bacterium]|nr:ABC transporter substrate-binding protein [Thermodesulfobacteriota bacterium]